MYKNDKEKTRENIVNFKIMFAKIVLVIFKNMIKDKLLKYNVRSLNFTYK